MFVNAQQKFGLMRRKIIFMTLFYSLPQNYSTPARNIFMEAFYYSIIIFKLCKLSVNLWTLCFSETVDNPEFKLVGHTFG